MNDTERLGLLVCKALDIVAEALDDLRPGEDDYDWDSLSSGTRLRRLTSDYETKWGDFSDGE